jgi:hypothetical protein
MQNKITNYRVAVENMESIYEALALLRSMIESGEKHSSKSLEVMDCGFDSIAAVGLFLQRVEYQNRAAREKPRCVAPTYNGRGKLVDCKRSAEFGSDYCFSHRDWKA